MSLLVKDALVKGTKALPSAASTTVYGAAIDTANSTRGDFVARGEFLLTYPAVTTTMAPDTRTFTYSIVESANSDLSTPTVTHTSVATQTGAGSAGDVGGTFKFRVKDNCARYIGVKIVSGASTADASAVSATLEMLL